MGAACFKAVCRSAYRGALGFPSEAPLASQYSKIGADDVERLDVEPADETKQA